MAERAAKPANNEGAKFVERIEALNDDLESEKGEYMARAKSIREDIKNVLGDAKDAGFTKATIRGVVKARALDAKAKAAYEDLDIADRDTFDSIRHSLGDYADLPLGKAAVDAAVKNGSAEAAAGEAQAVS